MKLSTELLFEKLQTEFTITAYGNLSSSFPIAFRYETDALFQFIVMLVIIHNYSFYLISPSSLIPLESDIWGLPLLQWNSHAHTRRDPRRYAR